MTTQLKYPFIDGCENLPNDKVEDIKYLKDWMSTQPHLPKISDEYLHLFLHSNYYKIKETQDNIETFFTMRANTPEFFSNRSPSGSWFRMVTSIANYAILKDSTPEGYKVIIIQTHDEDITKFNVVDCMKAFKCVIEVSISENKLSPGYIFIIDTKTYTYSHFIRSSWNINLLRKHMKYLQEGLPVRLKGFYTINAPSFMDAVWALMGSFVSSKLRELIQVHGTDITGMYKTVPKDMLPSDYGGKGDSMSKQHEELMKLIHGKYAKWLEGENAPAADMSKHPKARKKSYFSLW